MLAAGGAAYAQSAAEPSQEASSLYHELHPYLHDQFSPGEGSTGGIGDLKEIETPKVPVGDTTQLDGPLAFARRGFDSLYERTGLRLGLAFTALGAWASADDDPSGAAYDLDLLSAWTLVGRGTRNTGVLVATAEYRDAFTSQPPSALGAELGTLVNPVNAFNDRGWVARDIHWLQRLVDGKLRVLVGRADMGDYVGQQPMQNVNTLFVSRHFSGNPTVPFPGHGPTASVDIRPNDRFYLTAGMANAYGNTEEWELDSLDEGDFFYTAEAGYTPAIEGLGRGRYSIMGWHIDARDQGGAVTPSDEGVTLVAGQQLGDRLQVWARYAYADGTTTNLRQLAQAGAGYAGWLGSPSNMTGVAVSLARPRSDASRDEKALEVFQRVQVTRFTQLSFGAQAIVDPGNDPDEDLAGVFYARLRVAF